MLLVSIKQGPPPDRLSIAPEERTFNGILAAPVERVVEAWRTTGRMPGALEDFLYRRRPRLLHNAEGPIGDPIGAVMEMRGTTLCVQGPPGSGKA